MANETLDYEETLKSFVNGSVVEKDYDYEQFKNEYNSISVGEPNIKNITKIDLKTGNLTSVMKPNEEVS